MRRPPSSSRRGQGSRKWARLRTKGLIGWAFVPLWLCIAVEVLTGQSLGSLVRSKTFLKLSWLGLLSTERSWMLSRLNRTAYLPTAQSMPVCLKSVAGRLLYERSSSPGFSESCCCCLSPGLGLNYTMVARQPPGCPTRPRPLMI